MLPDLPLQSLQDPAVARGAKEAGGGETGEGVQGGAETGEAAAGVRDRQGASCLLLQHRDGGQAE